MWILVAGICYSYNDIHIIGSLEYGVPEKQAKFLHIAG
jgi:hypothetical protein